MIRNHSLLSSQLMWLSFICSIPFFLMSQSYANSSPPQHNTNIELAGIWTAQLDCPGGSIEFELELSGKNNKLSGFVKNGAERIRLDNLMVEGKKITIDFPHYDSVIVAKLNSKNQMQGTWTKVVGKNKTDTLRFRAQRGKRSYMTHGAKAIAARYAIKFDSSDDMAVGIFEPKEGFVSGTFLTTTGDYRFLAGSFDSASNLLTLSCFDGGHAFLFKAKADKSGHLQGDFWSRGSWHEKWTGTQNPKAKIDDGFKQVEWAGVKTSSLKFPGLDGKLRALNDESFSGKVKIIQVFGSWCPNCHDASVFLNELNESYQDQGLTIVGLAFELTGDFERDRTQILRYKKRTGADYPILIAGLADKAKATKQLRILSEVKSYPTTIFLDENDKPIAIHSGFTGPATGKAYERLKQRFKSIIEKQIQSRSP